MGAKYVFCVIGIESFIIYIHCCWSVYIYDFYLPSQVLTTVSAKLATEKQLLKFLWNFGISQFQNATYSVRLESAVKLWKSPTAGALTRLNVFRYG
jgi:hypothetical protein